ncbi:MAG: hypothetical protein V3V10_01045 [Planctomycetota bacterium]
MRKIIIILLLATLPACALLDGFLPTEQQHATDENGQQLYISEDGQTTTDAVDSKSGQPNKPVKITLLDAPTPQATQWTQKLGPWGGGAGGMLAILGGVYARVRNRQRLREAGMRKRAESELDLSKQSAEFLARLIEKIKEGQAVDSDGNGRVSTSEIRTWVKSQGSRFKDPKFLADLVRSIELIH